MTIRGSPNCFASRHVSYCPLAIVKIFTCSGTDVSHILPWTLWSVQSQLRREMLYSLVQGLDIAIQKGKVSYRSRVCQILVSQENDGCESVAGGPSRDILLQSIISKRTLQVTLCAIGTGWEA